MVVVAVVAVVVLPVMMVTSEVGALVTTIVMPLKLGLLVMATRNTLTTRNVDSSISTNVCVDRKLE